MVAILVFAGVAFLIWRASQGQGAPDTVTAFMTGGPGALPFTTTMGELIVPQGAISANVALEIVNRVNAEENLGLDPVDVLAVIRVESAFRPGAVSRVGARGLMQLMPPTAADMGFPDFGAMFDPENNIRAGMRYLRWLYDFLSRRLGTAPTDDQWFGAYNAGPGNVLRGYIPYTYARSVIAARGEFTIT